MAAPIPTAPAGVDADAWASAVKKVRGYCGWHIAPVITETITRDGSGGPVMVLPTLRLVDLVSITNDGTAVTDPEWSERGVVRLCRWTHKLRGVVAEIEHGFEEWPDDLTEVTKELAATPALGARVSAVTSGSHQVSFESAASVPIFDVLDRYALPFVQ